MSEVEEKKEEKRLITVYEVVVPEVTIHVKAKSREEALKNAKDVMIAALRQVIMKPQHWQTKPIVVYEGEKNV